MRQTEEDMSTISPWHETFSGLVGEDYLNGVTLEKCTAMAHRFPNNPLIAKDGDKVIGFASYGKYRDDTVADCGEVISIYVLAEYRGKGIGYSHMKAATENLSDYKRIAV